MWNYTGGLPVMDEDAAAERAARDHVAAKVAAADASGDALAMLKHASMRCGGCGAKVGADVLSRAMARLKPDLVSRPEVRTGASHGMGRMECGRSWRGPVVLSRGVRVVDRPFASSWNSTTTTTPPPRLVARLARSRASSKLIGSLNNLYILIQFNSL